MCQIRGDNLRSLPASWHIHRTESFALKSAFSSCVPPDGRIISDSIFIDKHMKHLLYLLKKANRYAKKRIRLFLRTHCSQEPVLVLLQALTAPVSWYLPESPRCGLNAHNCEYCQLECTDCPSGLKHPIFGQSPELRGILSILHLFFSQQQVS